MVYILYFDIPEVCFHVPLQKYRTYIPSKEFRLFFKNCLVWNSLIFNKNSYKVLLLFSRSVSDPLFQHVLGILK